MSATVSVTGSYPNLLEELAASAVLKRFNEQKIPLPDEGRPVLHKIWINVKEALSDTTIPQIMHTIEKDIIFQPKTQQQITPDFASNIELLWNTLTKKIGNNSLLIGINSYISEHKKWENTALMVLWNTISEKIGQLPNLTDIKEIETWFEDPANSKILESIENISLSSKNLRVLPPQLSKCSQLQALNIYNNKLTMLPEWFGNLSQLQEVDISFNQITELPESFGNLSQLRTVDISNNQITELPESFGNLSQLRTVDISDNQITAIPESFRNLGQLYHLFFLDNPITAIPECIRQVPNVSSNFFVI